MFQKVIFFIPGASTSQLDPASSILASDKFGETEIKELVNLGFTREQVRNYLLCFIFNFDKYYLNLIPLTLHLRFIAAIMMRGEGDLSYSFSFIRGCAVFSECCCVVNTVV